MGRGVRKGKSMSFLDNIGAKWFMRKMKAMQGDIDELNTNLDDKRYIKMRSGNSQFSALWENSVLKLYVDSSKIIEFEGIGGLRSYNFRFGSSNATETFNFGESLSGTAIFLGGRIGAMSMTNDSHIISISTTVSSITIRRDDSASYAGTPFVIFVGYVVGS